MKRLANPRIRLSPYAGTAAIFAVPLMSYLCYAWSTGTRLERRLATLRASGAPVQVADLGRKPIPTETNAETFIRRADDDLDAIQKELTALYPKTVYPSDTPSPADRERLEKLFAAHANLTTRRSIPARDRTQSTAGRPGIGSRSPGDEPKAAHTACFRTIEPNFRGRAFRLTVGADWLTIPALNTARPGGWGPSTSRM